MVHTKVLLLVSSVPYSPLTPRWNLSYRPLREIFSPVNSVLKSRTSSKRLTVDKRDNVPNPYEVTRFLFVRLIRAVCYLSCIYFGTRTGVTLHVLSSLLPFFGNPYPVPTKFNFDSSSSFQSDSSTVTRFRTSFPPLLGVPVDPILTTTISLHKPLIVTPVPPTSSPLVPFPFTVRSNTYWCTRINSWSRRWNPLYLPLVPQDLSLYSNRLNILSLVLGEPSTVNNYDDTRPVNLQ